MSGLIAHYRTRILPPLRLALMADPRAMAHGAAVGATRVSKDPSLKKATFTFIASDWCSRVLADANLFKAARAPAWIFMAPVG